LTVDDRGKVKEPIKTITTADYLRFILPSLLGILLFMVPLSIEGKITIPVAFLANQLEGLLMGVLPALMTVLLFIVVLLSVWMTIGKPDSLAENTFMRGLFDVHPVWLIVRVVGFLFAAMTLLEFGPSWIWSEDTLHGWEMGRLAFC